jgi:cytidine deaminase
MPDQPATELGAEDAKLVTLARATRARGHALEGAAVRDETGRTYTAATVELPSLQITALQLAVAMAASSGARRLEAAAVVTDHPVPAPEEIALVRELGDGGAPILVVAPDGTLTDTVVARS